MLSPSGPAYARERGPFPKGQLQWRKNSAEIPNKITLTMEHLTSCLHTKTKINSETKLLKVIIKLLKNTPLTQLYPKHGRETWIFQKFLRRKNTTQLSYETISWNNTHTLLLPKTMLLAWIKDRFWKQSLRYHIYSELVLNKPNTRMIIKSRPNKYI